MPYNAMQLQCGAYRMYVCIYIDASIGLRTLTDAISTTIFLSSSSYSTSLLIADGCTVLLSLASLAMLHLVYIQRCYIAFDGTVYQYSNRTYVMLFAAIVWLMLLAVFSCICYMNTLWTLTGIGFLLALLTILVLTPVTIGLFIRPMNEIIAMNRDDSLSELVIRVFVISLICLGTSALVLIFVFIGFVYCEFCIISLSFYLFFFFLFFFDLIKMRCSAHRFIGFGAAHFDAVVNIIGLRWSLPSGKAEYDRYCGWLHRYLSQHYERKQQKSHLQLQMRNTAHQLQASDCSTVASVSMNVN